jgi:hypothetical protein
MSVMSMPATSAGFTDALGTWGTPGKRAVRPRIPLTSNRLPSGAVGPASSCTAPGAEEPVGGGGGSAAAGGGGCGARDAGGFGGEASSRVSEVSGSRSVRATETAAGARGGGRR